MAAFLSPTTYNIIIFSRLSRIICAVNAIFFATTLQRNVWVVTTMGSKRVVVL